MPELGIFSVAFSLGCPVKIWANVGLARPEKSSSQKSKLVGNQVASRLVTNQFANQFLQLGTGQLVRVGVNPNQYLVRIYFGLFLVTQFLTSLDKNQFGMSGIRTRDLRVSAQHANHQAMAPSLEKYRKNFQSFIHYLLYKLVFIQSKLQVGPRQFDLVFNQTSSTNMSSELVFIQIKLRLGKLVRIISSCKTRHIEKIKKITKLHTSLDFFDLVTYQFG